jgi:hypothetical protein
MDDKKALEAFRVMQFSGPHPAAAAFAEPPALPANLPGIGIPGIGSSNMHDGDPHAPDMVPTYDRIVVHFDVDCFYAQVVAQLQQPGHLQRCVLKTIK